jgi:hypothetical protein
MSKSSHPSINPSDMYFFKQTPITRGGIDALVLELVKPTQADIEVAIQAFHGDLFPAVIGEEQVQKFLEHDKIYQAPSDPPRLITSIFTPQKPEEAIPNIAAHLKTDVKFLRGIHEPKLHSIYKKNRPNTTPIEINGQDYSGAQIRSGTYLVFLTEDKSQRILVKIKSKTVLLVLDPNGALTEVATTARNIARHLRDITSTTYSSGIGFTIAFNQFQPATARVLQSDIQNVEDLDAFKEEVMAVDIMDVAEAKGLGFVIKNAAEHGLPTPVVETTTLAATTAIATAGRDGLLVPGVPPAFVRKTANEVTIMNLPNLFPV